jgi:hypothetical protein
MASNGAFKVGSTYKFSDVGQLATPMDRGVWKYCRLYNIKQVK